MKTPKKTPKNLSPAWESGQSGNPNGRPKGSRNFKTLFLESIATLEKENEDIQVDIIKTLLEKALKGDLRAIEIYLDRVYGKPIQRLEGEVKAMSYTVTSNLL